MHTSSSDHSSSYSPVPNIALATLLYMTSWCHRCRMVKFHGFFTWHSVCIGHCKLLPFVWFLHGLDKQTIMEGNAILMYKIFPHYYWDNQLSGKKRIATEFCVLKTHRTFVMSLDLRKLWNRSTMFPMVSKAAGVLTGPGQLCILDIWVLKLRWRFVIYTGLLQ